MLLATTFFSNSCLLLLSFHSFQSAVVVAVLLQCKLYVFRRLRCVHSRFGGVVFVLDSIHSYCVVSLFLGGSVRVPIFGVSVHFVLVVVLCYLVVFCIGLLLSLVTHKLRVHPVVIVIVSPSSSRSLVFLFGHT